jgi:NADH-quinone oxidoreductase subunit G
MNRHPGVCTACATGCSIWVEENQDRIWRIKPRDNPRVNQWWICNDGRYDYPHVHSDRRLVGARRRERGSAVELDWARVPDELTGRLREAGRLAAVVSPFLTVEEAYLLVKFIRQIDPRAPLVLGPVPRVGQDEQFPGGFTIAAEKCPNRRGVEEVLAASAGGVTPFEAWLKDPSRGEIRGVWVSGGYKKNWIDEATASKFDGLEVLVVQDLFPSPFSGRAAFELSGAAYPERDGSYVNRWDHLQSVRWAIRPPGGVRPEGGLYWELLGREGLYDARAVLSEVAGEIAYFSAAAGPVPDVGVNLKVNLLADAAADGGDRTV